MPELETSPKNPTVFLHRDTAVPRDEFPNVSSSPGESDMSHDNLTDDAVNADELVSVTPDILPKGTQKKVGRKRKAKAKGEETGTTPDDEQNSTPSKHSPSPFLSDDDQNEAIPNETDSPPPKRRHRSGRIAPVSRRSSRTSRSSELKPEPATEVPAKRGRGRPPAKKNPGSASVKRGPGRPPKVQKPEPQAAGTEWEVEKIVDSQIDADSHEHFYLVKWKGFAAKENTWEPKKNLGHCLRTLRDFERDTKKKH